MAEEFKNFLRTVGENEGRKCHYPTRLDTYGCGCGHNCIYCYAKSQLSRRLKWNPEHPKAANIEKIRLEISKLPKGSIVRLGGLTDCFQPLEETERVTLKVIEILNEYGIGYLIVTKSALVADDVYINAYDRSLAHIQVSVTFTDEEECLKYEKASPPSDRIRAIEKLQASGFDVAVRLSPLIPGKYDPSVINAIKCDKLLVEFLRNDVMIKQWFTLDWSKWSVKESGYGHLPLEEKIRLLADFTDFKHVSVCEDCSEHYDYWKNHFNPNPDDCCNLNIDSSLFYEHETRRKALINARAKEKRSHINKPKRIKVTFPDGHFISEAKVQETYYKTILYIGPENVEKLGIVKAGSNIICTDISKLKPIYQKETLRTPLGNGKYLFFHMSTEAKVNLLVDINQRLHIGMKIEYV